MSTLKDLSYKVHLVSVYNFQLVNQGKLAKAEEKIKQKQQRRQEKDVNAPRV